MAAAKFVLALCLVALGCALLICSFEPRPVVAQWVGSGVHGAQSLFFARNGLPSATLELRTASK